MAARFGIVVSRFNQGVTEGLLEGALSVLEKKGIRRKDVLVRWVPGVYEIPLAAQRMLRSADAVVALGCVLKGETEHHRVLAHAAAQGLMRVMLDEGKPVAFGILTPDTLSQARARAGEGSANKGAEAAEAACEMAFRKRGRGE